MASSSANILSKQQIIRAVLLDLSGTLHIGDKPIPGALEAVQRLQSHPNLQVRFLTNTSKSSSEELVKQLTSMGFSVEPEHLITSVLATRKYLQRNNLRPFCIMEDVHDFVGHAPLDPPHDCVVVGLAPSKLNYEQLNTAFRILRNDDHDNKKPLIAIHRANYLRDVDGELSLGPGPFVTALESVTNTSAVVMGKPSRAFFESAAVDDIPLSETCMIGDDAVQDIQGAIDAGMGAAILVQTGKYLAGDEGKLKGGSTQVCPSIVEAAQIVVQQYTCAKHYT
jgi:HAD superfamily hydrolase (TIGR01458 family)